MEGIPCNKLLLYDAITPFYIIFLTTDFLRNKKKWEKLLCRGEIT